MLMEDGLSTCQSFNQANVIPAAKRLVNLTQLVAESAKGEGGGGPAVEAENGSRQRHDILVCRHIDMGFITGIGDYTNFIHCGETGLAGKPME